MALVDHLATLRIYEFESDLTDSAGVGPDLTDVNTVGFAAGHVGDALSLIAANDEYVSDPAMIFGTAGGTLLAWVKNTLGANQRAYVLNAGNITVGPYDDTVRLTIGESAFTQSWEPPLSDWFVLGLTIPPDATRADVKVWMWTQAGGLVSGSGTGTAAINLTTGISFGSNGTVNRDWHGLIDQALVLPGAALTEAEILEYVNNGAGVSYADLNTADETAPTLQSAVISADGLSLTLTFDEVVSIGAGGNGGFVLSASGGAASLAYTSGDGTSSLVYAVGREIQYDETATLAYTQPGDGIEDGAGNDLASFADFAVTNNSEAGVPLPSLTGTLSVVGVGLATSGTMYAANITTGQISTTSVGGDGAFSFSGLVAGTYRVWGEVAVDVDTYTTQVRIVEVL